MALNDTWLGKLPVCTHIRRILVVEDNPDLGQSIMDHLMEQHFDVTLNPGYRIGMGDVLSYKPDLVLLDWMLPSIEGIQLVRQMKAIEMTRHIPCILMTGRRSESDTIAVYDAGADAYLGKPFGMDLLTTVIWNLERRIDQRNAGGGGVDPQPLIEHQSLVRAFQQLVEMRHADPGLTLADFCRALHCTRQTLIERTKRATGLTPYAYLKSYRLQRARDLLLRQDMSVTDVAFAVGYRDLAVFSKMFKADFGISPKQFAQSTLRSVTPSASDRS